MQIVSQLNGGGRARRRRRLCRQCRVATSLTAQRRRAPPAADSSRAQAPSRADWRAARGPDCRLHTPLKISEELYGTRRTPIRQDKNYVQFREMFYDIPDIFSCKSI